MPPEDLAYMVSVPPASPVLSLALAAEQETAQELAAGFMRFQTVYRGLGGQAARAMMVTAAHLGAVDLVRALTLELGTELGRHHGAFWIATAEQRAGDVVSARHTLGSVSSQELQGVAQRMIERRMMFPLCEASLGPHALALRRELRQRVFARAVLLGQRGQVAWASWLLALTLTAVFVAQSALGELGPAELAPNGGLTVPPRGASGVLAVFTYGLLHASPGHFVLNTASLLALGRPVERRVGPWRFGLVFIASSALGGLFFLLTAPPDTVLVGASGGVLGLVSASLSHAGTHRALRATPEGRALILGLVTFIAARLALDLGAREVSSAAHLGGLLAGALLGASKNTFGEGEHQGPTARGSGR